MRSVLPAFRALIFPSFRSWYRLVFLARPGYQNSNPLPFAQRGRRRLVGFDEGSAIVDAPIFGARQMCVYKRHTPPSIKLMWIGRRVFVSASPHFLGRQWAHCARKRTV